MSGPWGWSPKGTDLAVLDVTSLLPDLAPSSRLSSPSPSPRAASQCVLDRGDVLRPSSLGTQFFEPMFTYVTELTDGPRLSFLGRGHLASWPDAEFGRVRGMSFHISVNRALVLSAGTGNLSSWVAGRTRGPCRSVSPAWCGLVSEGTGRSGLSQRLGTQEARGGAAVWAGAGWPVLQGPQWGTTVPPLGEGGPQNKRASGTLRGGLGRPWVQGRSGKEATQGPERSLGV